MCLSSAGITRRTPFEWRARLDSQSARIWPVRGSLSGWMTQTTTGWSLSIYIQSINKVARGHTPFPSGFIRTSVWRCIAVPSRPAMQPSGTLVGHSCRKPQWPMKRASSWQHWPAPAAPICCKGTTPCPCWRERRSIRFFSMHTTIAAF